MVVITLAQKKDASEWDHVVRHCRNGTFYHLFLWREIYQTVGKPYYFLGREAGEVVGILPLVEVEEKGIRKLLSVPQGVGGICISEKVSEKSNVANSLIQAAKDEARSSGCHQMEIKADSFQAEWYTGWRSIRYALGSTVQIKEDWEAVWKHVFNKKARKNVNYARKLGCVTKVFSNYEITENLLSIFYEMHKEVSDRHEQEPISFEIFKAICRRFEDKCYLCMTYYENLPVAVRFFLADSELRTVYMYMGASKSDYWKYKPNDVGYSDTIQWASQNNFRFVDLGLSPYPSENSGHVHFKERWGGIDYKVDLFQYDLRPVALLFKKVLRKAQVFRNKTFERNYGPDFE